MVQEKTTKEFEYYPREDIDDADFTLHGGFEFNVKGVNLNYNAARIDILLPGLFIKGDVGMMGEKILRDGFEKILLGQATPWKITDIQPLPDSLRIRFIHEHARSVLEECDDGLNFWEKRNAKKILDLFEGYEIDAVLRYSRQEGCFNMSFCLAFEDSGSLVCFSGWEDYSKVSIETSAYTRELEYVLTWADEDHEELKPRKIHAVITRKFEF